jgi:hypothetical protein
MANSAPKPMTTSSLLPTGSALDEIIGAPHLIPGEDRAAHAELLARMMAAVQPADIIDEISVGNLVYLVWNSLRLRRHKARYLEAEEHRGLRYLIDQRSGSDVRIGYAADLARRYDVREPAATKEANEFLTKHHLTWDSVRAQTLVLSLDVVERIDRMITQAEARYNAQLREIDRRRDRVALARRLRKAAQAEIEEPTISTVEIEGRVETK